MSRQGKIKTFSSIVYVVLIAGLIWQGFALVKNWKPGALFPNVKSHKISIEGNVRRPGVYRVPKGTTTFEILKVAGIRPTSNLIGFNLASQIESNSTLEVGTLDKPVSTTADSMLVRLEFFFGEISIITANGQSLPQQQGTIFSAGDRIQTEQGTQAELSYGNFSRISVDNFSELIVEKIAQPEDNKRVLEATQPSGTCWYRIAYMDKSDLCKIKTPLVNITVGGSGADYLVEMKDNQVTISLMDGLLLLEKTSSQEALNLISGQSVTVYSDNRPFQVSRLAPDVSASERFSQLSQQKSIYISRSYPFNLLFCGLPSTFFILSVQFESGAVKVIQIPPDLLIEQFAQGIHTVDEAFLYGGPIFVASLLERVLNIRIPKYGVFTKDDIVRIVTSLGGVNIELDAKAASYLKKPQGKYKLVNQDLIHFLSPEMSGFTDSRERQAKIMESMFNSFKDKNIVLTTLLTDQMLTNVETNLTSSEAMTNYTKFTSRPSWNYKRFNVPGKVIKRGDRDCLDPTLDECRKILTTSL